MAVWSMDVHLQIMKRFEEAMHEHTQTSQRCQFLEAALKSLTQKANELTQKCHDLSATESKLKGPALRIKSIWSRIHLRVDSINAKQDLWTWKGMQWSWRNESCIEGRHGHAAWTSESGTTHRFKVSSQHHASWISVISQISERSKAFEKWIGSNTKHLWIPSTISWTTWWREQTTETRIETWEGIH